MHSAHANLIFTRTTLPPMATPFLLNYLLIVKRRQYVIFLLARAYTTLGHCSTRPKIENLRNYASSNESTRFGAFDSI